MAEVLIRIVRVTDPSVAIANAARYNRRIDAAFVPQIGDWIQFNSGRHKVESRTWEYGDDETPSCSLGIDFVGQEL
jgi:hypothetical protein